MEVKDLMVDDIVRVNKDVCIKKGTIVRATAIDSEKSHANFNLKGCAHCVNIKDIYNSGGVWGAYLDAIELSGEILEKLGFTYCKRDGDKEEWWIEDDHYDIVVYEFSDSIWVFRYESTEMNIPHEQRTMSYLHQLQHAFKDCGIEKEIEL